jgi:hypothetical protein
MTLPSLVRTVALRALRIGHPADDKKIQRNV